MKLFTPQSTPGRLAARHARWLAVTVVVAMVATATTAEAAATAVPLRTATQFAVLAGSGITIIGPTTITGDIGSFPTPSMTTTGTLILNGTNHAGDVVTQGAKDDLVAAYNNASSQGPTMPITADLGGQILTPGVYNSASSIGLTGTLTLNGEGNRRSVFIFQANASTLTTASASRVLLINGAQACNVFWQVGSSATLGTTTDFSGTILAQTSVTANTGATVHGRLLALDGAVTLNANTITRPTCASSGPTPTPRPTSSGTPGPTPTPGGSPNPGSTPTSGGSPTPAQVTSHPTPSPPRNSFGLTG